MIEEKQLRKYLTYAIGEILLVSIGILLALQVNNWNGERKSRLEEQVILNGLNELITRNQNDLEHSSRVIQAAFNASSHLLTLFHSTDHVSSRIDSLLAVISNPADFDPYTGVLDDLLNSGKLGIIRDAELRDKLSAWSGIMSDLEDDHEIMRMHTFDLMIPFLIKQGVFINTDSFNGALIERATRKAIRSRFVVNYDELMASAELENHIYQALLNYEFILFEYEQIKRYLKDLFELVNSNKFQQRFSAAIHLTQGVAYLDSIYFPF